MMIEDQTNGTDQEQAEPQWLPVLQVQDILGLTRYHMRRMRIKYRLSTRKTFDGRIKLININALRQCIEFERS
jgi:hypothetical protein